MIEDQLGHIEEDELGHIIWRPHPDLVKQARVTSHPSPVKAGGGGNGGGAAPLAHSEKIAYIAERFKEIMEMLGLDLSDPSLSRTPLRVAKMYLEEIFAGLCPENFPPITLMPDSHSSTDTCKSHPIFVKMAFTSFCEHHFVPMQGMAYVAYCPRGTLIGLSKIPRIVKFFASRPQLQERLTAQIADSLATLLQTEDVAVSITANHFCVVARGIENSASHTTTTLLRGRFDSEAALRSEFFEAINRRVEYSNSR